MAKSSVSAPTSTPTTNTPKTDDLLGKNTVLTLTIEPMALTQEYALVLKREALKVTIKGFRQGKAPIKLAESYIGKDNLMEQVLNHLLPHLYQAEIAKQGLLPLVHPEYSGKETEEGKPWIFEAATAIAPEVVLGEYQKLIKAGSSKYDKKLSETKDSKENVDERLQAIFVSLIEAVKPKIAPLLLQEEMNQQLKALLTQLESRRIGLSDYIKAQGKTEEQFRDDLAALSLGALQLEFVLQAITKDLGLKMSDIELQAWMKSQNYPEDTKLPEELRMRLEATLLRRKTTDEILKMGLPS